MVTRWVGEVMHIALSYWRYPAMLAMPFELTLTEYEILARNESEFNSSWSDAKMLLFARSGMHVGAIRNS